MNTCKKHLAARWSFRRNHSISEGARTHKSLGMAHTDRLVAAPAICSKACASLTVNSHLSTCLWSQETASHEFLSIKIIVTHSLVIKASRSAVTAAGVEQCQGRVLQPTSSWKVWKGSITLEEDLHRILIIIST